ncbi:MAG: antibiotic biosynthesis monooxygenase family protein [Phycisphaerae bacterium]|jgi:heme-degrading monooxygenase HmoA
MPKLRLRTLLVPIGGFVAAVPFLASCQMAAPFKGPGYTPGKGVTLPGATDTVWIGLTNAQLDGSNRAVFDDYTNRVIRDLPSREGHIGHSVRTRVFGNEVWTMTIWRDEAALNAFVRAPVHREAMREGISAVKSARFARFAWPASQVPPSWTEAKRRLSEVEPVTYGAAP